MVVCTCRQLMPVEGARSDGAEGKCEEEQGHNTGVKPVAVAMDTAMAAVLSIFKYVYLLYSGQRGVPVFIFRSAAKKARARREGYFAT